MNEVWKDIVWYEWLYQVSNLWKLLRIRDWYISKYGSDNVTYIFVNLEKEWRKITKALHRLVAIAFIPNPNNYPIVNHIDWNKQNPKVENLEWVTASENIQHAFRTWLNKYPDSRRVKKYPN